MPADEKTPRVFGVPMVASHSGSWRLEFGQLEVEVQLWGGKRYSAFINSGVVSHAAPLRDSIEAVESRLSIIADAIGKAERGAKRRAKRNAERTCAKE